MSEEKDFNFDKFMVDIEKRNNLYKENNTFSQYIVDEDQRRRRRSELYHERWQNQIKWENK